MYCVSSFDLLSDCIVHDNLSCHRAVLHSFLRVCGLWSVCILHIFHSAVWPILERYTVLIVRPCSQFVDV